MKPHLIKNIIFIMNVSMFLITGCGSTPEATLVFTDTPIPTRTPIVFSPEAVFPIGRFEDEINTRAFEFDQDGNWRYFENDLEIPLASGKYGTNGNLYSVMTHDYTGEREVPATYFWAFDGKQLTFQLWGVEHINHRKNCYNDQSYVLTDTSELLGSQDESNGDMVFPQGRFKLEGSIHNAKIQFLDDGFYKGEAEGIFYSGRYVVNGNLFTMITHDIQGFPKIPGTYHWEYDGENLTFRVWGEDLAMYRVAVFDRKTYQKIDN